MKPTPRYLSRTKLLRYGTKRLTKKELVSLAKKKSDYKPTAFGHTSLSEWCKANPPKLPPHDPSN